MDEHPIAPHNSAIASHQELWHEAVECGDNVGDHLTRRPRRGNQVLLDQLLDLHHITIIPQLICNYKGLRLARADPAEIVRENPWRILARLLPGAVIVDRSAAGGGRISSGVLFVAAETSRKTVSLPGLEIRIRSGRAFDGPVADSMWPEGLHMSSAARTLLDNLAPSRGRRGHVPRTLSRAELEDWLAGKAIAWGPERTERLRAECHELAAALPGDHRLDLVDALFGQLHGVEPVRRDAGEMFKAFRSRSAGSSP